MTPDLLKALQIARAESQPICLVSTQTKGAIALLDPKTPDGHATDLLEAAAAALRTDQLQTLEAESDVFYVAPFNPPVTVFIIGAVHIAQMLLPLLATIGFAAVIIDPRSAFASDARFTGAQVINEWPDEALAAQPITPRSAIVTLTHDPKLDDPALDCALQSEAFYIGSLGSKRTHAQRVERLKQRGFSDDQISRIAAPVGLNIGGRNPAEIALSIAAQIVEALRKPVPHK
jgi:xanthine dehydrogenase accessory factor